MKSRFIKTSLKDFLNEERGLDIYNLLKYLTPTNDEKEICIREHFDDLISRFSNLIPYFFEQNDISFDYDKEEDEIIDFLYENNYDNLFEDWLIKNFDDFYFEDFDIPSWYYFKNPEIVKGSFIHFTNNANEIINKGFVKGIDDMSILGMTTHLGNEYKKNGGFNFAYYIKDIEAIKDVSKYGKEAVIFEGIGIRAYHKIDEEYEVIFNSKDISNIKKYI